MSRILDALLTSLWRVIRLGIPDRDPPGFIQKSVDRRSTRIVLEKNRQRRERLGR